MFGFLAVSIEFWRISYAFGNSFCGFSQETPINTPMASKPTHVGMHAITRTYALGLHVAYVCVYAMHVLHLNT